VTVTIVDGILLLFSDKSWHHDGVRIRNIIYLSHPLADRKEAGYQRKTIYPWITW